MTPPTPTSDRCTWVTDCRQRVAGVAVSPYVEQLDLPRSLVVCFDHAHEATAAGWVVNLTHASPMSTPTAQDIAAAVHRAALSLAEDPEVRYYSPDTIALVLKRTVVNMAGARDLAIMAQRLANDPALADVPHPVVEALMVASYKHFARAIARGPS